MTPMTPSAYAQRAYDYAIDPAKTTAERQAAANEAANAYRAATMPLTRDHRERD